MLTALKGSNLFTDGKSYCLLGTGYPKFYDF